MKRIIGVVLSLCISLCFVGVMPMASAANIYVKLNIDAQDALSIEVESGESILLIKEKIEEEARIKVENQVLYFGETRLDDEKTVEDYGIIEESTLTLHAHRSGDKSTCCSRKTCVLCEEEYGEINPKNHEGETEIRGYKAETTTENGYSGDVYCLSCGELVKEGAVINSGVMQFFGGIFATMFQFIRGFAFLAKWIERML